MKKYKFLIVFLAIINQSCSTQSKKINGISFVASSDAINNTHIAPVVNINANYAAIMPFGFITDLKQPNIQFNSNRQWFGETRAGAK